jgi:kanamycin kinase
VPEVIEYGSDGDVEWLVSLRLPGEPATAARHLARPLETVRLLAEGLRALHDVDPAGCPFDHGLTATLRHIDARIDRGELDPDGFNREHRGLSVVEARARLEATTPAEEDLVLTHGDYCFPNVMIESGRFSGYLDLGEAGLADRWRDLAVATWSTTWNVGSGWEDAFLEAYGVDWDAPRCAFYRLLYDLES